ncbi:hypothetical protein H9P43_003948 [Blastocladiella emersonii ATCC 22665]|nr:hypothetical protein H9P43_003948 [Blastocladiella emersonii ATCC 22665]
MIRTALRRLHTTAPAVPASGGKSAPVNQDYALAQHRAAMKAVRKQYFADTEAAQRAARDAERARAKERLAQTEALMADPLVVGTYAPRRELKRQRLRNNGQFERIPVGVKAPLAPATAPPAAVPDHKRNVHRQMRRVFRRDLTPDNPRLMHLLHLWNASASFVTAKNVDDKINDFFKLGGTGPAVEKLTTAPLTPLTTALEAAQSPFDGVAGQPSFMSRLHSVVEFGVTDKIHSLADFDAATFADADKSFAPDLANPHLEGGSPIAHAATRDVAVKDKISGSLFGLPGVTKVLEWGKTVTDPAAYGWIEPVRAPKAAEKVAAVEAAPAAAEAPASEAPAAPKA